MKTKRTMNASIPNQTRKSVYERDMRCRPLRAPPLPPRPPFFARGGAHWFALRRV